MFLRTWVLLTFPVTSSYSVVLDGVEQVSVKKGKLPFLAELDLCFEYIQKAVTVTDRETITAATIVTPTVGNNLCQHAIFVHVFIYR